MTDDEDRRERRPTQPRRQSQVAAQTTHRMQPRMSLHGLAEYPIASHTRKRRILEQEKNPGLFQTAFRRKPDDAIRRCLRTGGKDRRRLDEAMDFLRRAKPKNEYEAQQAKSGIETLESFGRCLAKSLLPLDRLQRPPKDEIAWKVEGVEISAAPDAVVVRDGVIVGAVKRYLKKKPRLGGKRADFAGVILRRYVDRISPGNADPRSCYLLDVHGAVAIPAPKSHTNAWRELTAVCRDVFALWPAVEIKPPRPDRKGTK